MRDLFFNVPARRKFLKSTGTESAHVSEALLLAALARPDVSFFLVRDGRAAREWLRVPSRRERAAQAIERRAARGVLGRARPAADRGATSRRPSGRAPARWGCTCSSTAGPCAIGRWPVPSRRRTARCSSPGATRSAWSTSRSRRGRSTSTCTRRRPRCASPTDARCSTRVTRELHAALARAFSLPALGPARPWAALSQASRRARSPGPRSAPAPSTRGAGDPWQLSAGQERRPGHARPSATPSLPGAGPPAARAPALFEGAGFYASLEFLGAGAGDVPRVQRDRRPLRARPARRGRAGDVPPAPPGVRGARRSRRSGCSSPT